MRTAVLAALLLATAACIRETPDVSQNTPSQSSTTTDAVQTSSMNPVVPIEKGGDTGSRTPVAADPEQRVGLEEYQIRMPQQLPSGKHVFSVANAGKEDHAFEIEGNGVHTKTQTLKRGDTTRLEVNLPPGTYTVYCPVNGHKDKGMRTTITVQ